MTLSLTDTQHNNALDYAEYGSAECHVLSIATLSVITLGVVMLNTVMMNAIMPNIVMVNVVMLSCHYAEWRGAEMTA